MTTMGRHSPPIDGTVTANGHALAPFTIGDSLTGRPRGPVSALPPQICQICGHPVDGLSPHPPECARCPEGYCEPRQDDTGRLRHAVTSHRGWLAAVPIVLVNAVAFAGQLAFLRTHLPWPLAGQVLVAVTLESVAVYLAWQAHLALAADDSALRLRLAAYLFALVIGVMNYSHWMAAGWRPTFAAVTFGLMSVSSPWLWSVHSRRVSRDGLKERGLIEAHAVRLGATRWLWHPVRCVRVMSRASWRGETDPAKAIALSAPAGTPEDRAEDSHADSVPDNRADKTAAIMPSRKVTARTGRDKAADIIRRHPDWTDTAVAKAAGVSTKTVQRARNSNAGSMT